MFDRGEPERAAILLEFDGGVSWRAHPDEPGQRTSHALQGADGVWLIDPLDATNLDEIVAPLGEIAGIAVLSRYHARDSGVLANRYDVSVHVPAWMNGEVTTIDPALTRYTIEPGDSGFRILPSRPFPAWEEVFLFDERSNTLVAPDTFGTCNHWVCGDERLGIFPVRRLQPPTQLLGLEPGRILVGHGDPIDEDAPAALESAIRSSRRRFPRAILENGRQMAKSVLAAMD